MAAGCAIYAAFLHRGGDYAGFCATHDIKVATGGVCIFTSEDGTTWQCTEWGVKAFKHV
jgi:probable phosphoglycerate mutase